MIPKEVLQKIRRLEIRMRGLVANVFSGEYHSAFKGSGMEFAEVRPYQIGDDVRNIDWNVSARFDEPFVKVFQEEREQTLMIVVDVSGSEQFGTQGFFKKDLAAEIGAILGFSAQQNNDKVGLLLFSDEVELFVPPQKGKRHILRLIREIYVHEPKSKKTNLNVPIQHLLRVLHRRSIVIWISDFMAEQYEQNMRILARKHDCIAICLVDKRERYLPNVGLIRLIDAETGVLKWIDTADKGARNSINKQLMLQRQNRAETLNRLRIDVVEIDTDGDYMEPLNQFFIRRSKRL